LADGGVAERQERGYRAAPLSSDRPEQRPS
jgi:hypothetical protein